MPKYHFAFTPGLGAAFSEPTPPLPATPQASMFHKHELYLARRTKISCVLEWWWPGRKAFPLTVWPAAARPPHIPNALLVPDLDRGHA